MKKELLQFAAKVGFGFPLAAACRIFNIGNPVSLATRQSRLFAFVLETHRCMLQERGLDTLEGVGVDCGVEATFNSAGNHRNNAALGANVELRGFGPEGVHG